MADHYLPTSNMSVKALLQMLGVSTPKAIFYNNGVLDQTHMLSVVNKNLLTTYCPGSTADDKADNLFADRKLSYFKGYGYSDNVSLLPSRGMDFDSVTSSWFSGSTQNNFSEYYFEEVISSGQVTFVLSSTTYPSPLYLDVVINGVVQTALRQSVSNSGGTYYVNLPTTLYYPDTISFQINT
jgi:hypothetical protein